MQKYSIKLMKILHITCSQLWLGGAAAVLFLGIHALNQSTGSDTQAILALIPQLYRTIVLPAALICLIQGVIYATVFHFGFIRQKWLGFKWLFALVIALCTGLGSINQVFSLLELSQSTALSLSNGTNLLAFTTAQIVLLVLINILSVVRIR